MLFSVWDILMHKLDKIDPEGELRSSVSQWHAELRGIEQLECEREHWIPKICVEKELKR